MSAKELRAAAEWLHKIRLACSNHTCTLIDYVLSTVREDDEHHIEWQWLQAVTGYEREVSGLLVSVNVTEELSLVGDLEYPNVWQVWFNEYEIGECVDRAGFRSLCRGLGIKLKEPTACETPIRLDNE